MILKGQRHLIGMHQMLHLDRLLHAKGKANGLVIDDIEGEGYAHKKPFMGGCGREDLHVLISEPKVVLTREFCVVVQGPF